MPDFDAEMLAYVKLAGVSQSRSQLGPRDKFLVLAGAAACRAGWLPVAERCRELIVAHNPAHLIRRYDSFVAAMHDGDFAVYLQSVGRFCPYEKAEHLLAQLEIAPAPPPLANRPSAGEYALLLLGHSERDKE